MRKLFRYHCFCACRTVTRYKIQFNTERGTRHEHLTAPDGARIFYKDWGRGQPILFSHGWPLSADAWDNQLLFSARAGSG